MDSIEYSAFRRKLVRWYTTKGRDLPWRRTNDPYRIWISEIMLQQTTVAAVIPYFERFIDRFATIVDLANADENEVLRFWEGLGYYSRARNIHKAANIIVDQHSGSFPTDLQSLQALPGIGRYTAGAIASFAFDQRAPIVEANTLRLYCRLLGFSADPRSPEAQQLLWSFALAILPKSLPGRMNQALMELGATICSPRDPSCDSCPVQMHCVSFREGTQSEIPRPKLKTEITEVTEVSVAIRNGRKFLLRRRTPKERWAGLWDFIRFEIEREIHEPDHRQLIDGVLARSGLSIELGPQIAELKHAVTRYRITLKCITANRVRGRLKADEEWQWLNPAEFDKFPLSVTARQFAERLKDC